MDIKKFKEDGYLHIPNFFEESEVANIFNEARSIFLSQFIYLGYTHKQNASEFEDEEFNQLVFRLFQEYPERLIACGKNVQHLISLHRFSIQDKIVDALKELGLEFPNICTRPMLFFNSRHLAKKQSYWKTDPHQDWRSMQGSLNSVVLWLPLIDIDMSLGALEIIPKSHKLGLVANELVDSFGTLSETDLQGKEFQPVEVKRGDALFFSSFLFHQSGNNSTEHGIRWSCHFRYNDLKEQSFIERGFPHPYVYYPDSKLITPDFPKQSDIDQAFS